MANTIFATRKRSWQRHGDGDADTTIFVLPFECIYADQFTQLRLHVCAWRQGCCMLRCSHIAHHAFGSTSTNRALKSFAQHSRHTRRSKIPLRNRCFVWFFFFFRLSRSDKCCEIYRATVESIDSRINKVLTLAVNRLVKAINVFTGSGCDSDQT